MREIVRLAEEEIDGGADPTRTWDQISAWVEQQVAAAASANFVWATQRARWLAEQVAAHFSDDQQAVLPALRTEASDALRSVRAMVVRESEPWNLGQKALTGLRGGYIGVLMFGMLGTFVGLSLINPFSIGAGLMLGGKTISDERRRIINRRQTEARTSVRRYIDDVIFQVGKDSRDMLRGVQRDLRDHFTEQAEQTNRSLQESLRAAERSVSSSQADRERRLAEIETELAALERLRKRVRTLLPSSKSALACPGEDAGGRDHMTGTLTDAVRGVLDRAVEIHATTHAPSAGCAATSTASTNRCASPSRARSRPASRRCSTRWWGSRSRRPTRGSARGSSPGTATRPRRGSWCTRSDGPPVALPVDRRDGALVIDLGGARRRGGGPHGGRLAVAEPAHRHADRHPGHRVAVHATSARRTVRFLNPEDDTPTEADAVVYLMRHLHASDAEFLEAFRDQGVARAASVNTVGGDLPGRRDRRRPGGRDGLGPRRGAPLPQRARAARAVPERRRGGRAARRRPAARCGRPSSPRCASWPPRRARTSRPRCSPPTASPPTTDRSPASHPPPPRTSGARLLRRFGVFGVRLAHHADPPGHRRARRRWPRSCVRPQRAAELQHVLHTQFTERRDLLKARSALLALEAVLRGDAPPRDGGARARGRADLRGRPRVRRAAAARRAALRRR